LKLCAVNEIAGVSPDLLPRAKFNAPAPTGSRHYFSQKPNSC